MHDATKEALKRQSIKDSIHIIQSHTLNLKITKSTQVEQLETLEENYIKTCHLEQ